MRNLLPQWQLNTGLVRGAVLIKRHYMTVLGVLASIERRPEKDIATL